MRVLEVSEIEVVAGTDLLSDIGKGALAGGFAGLIITRGNPMGFLAGAATGAALGAAYSYFGGGGGGGGGGGSSMGSILMLLD